MSVFDSRPWPGASGDPIRDRLIGAMISLTGTHGYQATTVDAICALAEVHSSEFRNRFADIEDCYVAAHEQTATEFGERVIAAFDFHTAWHDSMWAAAWAALGYLREDPVRARFFAVEVNGAGPRAQDRRDGVMRTFAILVDGGRSELEDPTRVSRATAEMVAGACYSTIQQKIIEGIFDRDRDGDGDGDFLVELLYIAVLPYLGADAAEAELRVQPLR